MQITEKEIAKKSEILKIGHRKWRMANKGKIAERNRIYFQNNRGKILKENTSRKKKKRESLADYYIRQVLRGLQINYFTPELIALKREQLKIHRFYMRAKKEMFL